ncbi:MAG: winged helix-turn-helix domain-containing protein [Bacteroidales bacterium]|nr:winged helix-turn-helix domain-containing protein [Bacteroidales bacterium]
MKSYIISQHAGKIWDILSSVYVEKANNIKHSLNIEEFEFYMAIGWLAHDKNIFISNIKNELYLSNKRHLENHLHFIWL